MTLYPTTPGARHDAEAALQVDLEAAWRPEPPRPVPPGHVVLSVVTDRGVHAETVLPAGHEYLPDLLARRATRVRAIAPGITLPEPEPDPDTPLSALLPEHRPIQGTLTHA